MMRTSAERLADRYLRRRTAANEMQLLQGISNQIQAIQQWGATLAFQAQTMRALITAGEKRRLGRVSQIQIKNLKYDGQHVDGTMLGSQGNVYHTRITILPRRGHQCDCPDWKQRGRTVGPCKHVLRLGQEWLEAHVLPALEGLEDRLIGVLEHTEL